jgi:DNA-3-methyladenine glycosylase II
VFPADDVGARNKLQRFFDLPTAPNREQILALLDPLAPFAGMLYFHLLLDGLAERGELDV